MTDFDDAQFLDIQRGAASLVRPLEQLFAEQLRDGIKNVWFLGTGGAGILMGPAVNLLRAESSFPVYTDWAAEVVLGGSKNIGAGSIVVIPSLSGTTAESITAMEWATEAGATVVTLTAHADSPLALRAHHTFTAFAQDPTSSESFYMQSLAIALAILKHHDRSPWAETVLDDLTRLPDALLAVKQEQAPAMSALADVIATTDFHIVTGAGGSWAEAFYYGMCILEEMQWITTRPVHASDFFHGTLELLEADTSVLILKGEDWARPLTDRVERFARGITSNVHVLDSASYSLPGFSEQTRSLISPILFATVLERLSSELERRRGHALTTRRYYRQMQY